MSSMERKRDGADTSSELATGDPAAADSLFPLLYDELRRIAHRQLSVERVDHTLSTTALVHEAYVKLADQTRAQFASRAHFLAVAAQAMRRILVTHARKVRAEKRGGTTTASGHSLRAIAPPIAVRTPRAFAS